MVNFDLPVDADSYIHRIGRTGRAGIAGVAVSFCDQGEQSSLRTIQRGTRQTLAVESCPAGMPAARATQTPAGRPAAASTAAARAVEAVFRPESRDLCRPEKGDCQGGNPGFQGSHADGHPGLKSA